jgi:hypothetical protein
MHSDDNKSRPRESKIHDDATKRMTMQGVTTAETENGQRFSPGALARGGATTTVPPRRTRHPRAPSPLAPKHWALLVPSFWPVRLFVARI